MPRDDTHDRPVHRYSIGNDSILSERDCATVQAVVDSWVADWNVSATVALADAHTIRIAVHGHLSCDQRDRLAKEIWREAERIEHERLS